jgi:hypothetical protein
VLNVVPPADPFDELTSDGFGRRIAIGQGVKNEIDALLTIEMRRRHQGSRDSRIQLEDLYAFAEAPGWRKVS